MKKRFFDLSTENIERFWLPLFAAFAAGMMLATLKFDADRQQLTAQIDTLREQPPIVLMPCDRLDTTIAFKED